jgi:hypothetical protein
MIEFHKTELPREIGWNLGKMKIMLPRLFYFPHMKYGKYLFSQQRAGTEIRVDGGGGWNLNTSLLLNCPWASERFYLKTIYKTSKLC